MLIDLFSNQIEISDALQKELEHKISTIKFSKNDLILKQGSVGKYLYYIEKGLVRGYHVQRGKEISLYFPTEGDLVTSASSLIGEKPSFENIVALEDCTMQAISRKDLYEFYDTHAEMNVVGRKLTEYYFLEIEERANAMQFQTSKQRYKNFLAMEAHLLERVSLGHLASYLGMTQETLSRIRKQQKK